MHGRRRSCTGRTAAAGGACYQKVCCRLEPPLRLLRVSSCGAPPAHRSVQSGIISLRRPIDLCLKVETDWAKFRKRKGAIKLHLILDHGGTHPQLLRDDPRSGARDRGGARPALPTGQQPDDLPQLKGPTWTTTGLLHARTTPPPGGVRRRDPAKSATRVTGC